jgi:mRNA interferase RelE/StbE
MPGYEVRLKSSVEKDLRDLPSNVKRRVLERIESLAVSPLPRGSVKRSGAERLHRLRVGEYRIVYEVDHTAREIKIHYVRHRRDAYRLL